MTQERYVQPGAGREHQPTVGDLVESILGESLGRVSQVSLPVFEVSTPSGAVRLTVDTVFTRTHHLVTLICDRDGLARYALPARAASRAR